LPSFTLRTNRPLTTGKMSFKVAAPDEYLAITGMGIKTVKITKATWVFPFQRCMRFRYVISHGLRNRRWLILSQRTTA
jgi:hypothetical protein